MTEEKILECVKCHKKKKESEGLYIWSGSTYCCKECCGNPAKDEPKQQTANTCEFC